MSENKKAEFVLGDLPHTTQIPKESPTTSSDDICQKLSTLLCKLTDLSTIEAENILSNYIYIMDLVKADLALIDARLIELREQDQALPSDEEYAHKRCRYFVEKNRNARDNIVRFVIDGIEEQLVRSKSFKYFDCEPGDEKLFFLEFRYDFAFFGRYYNPNYDFSTEVKFRFIPGVTIENTLTTIAKYIQQKKDDPNGFANIIDLMVSKNSSIQFVCDKVKTHYYLYRRREIFETLTDLYNDGRYLAFIALAMTQMEGIFYDCLTIMNKAEQGNKAGTLIEKAGKVFSQNEKVMQSLYPYFAFTVPILRNEIAHNGITTCDNPEHLSNEVILDLNCIVQWACHLSDDKYYSILVVYKALAKKRELAEQTSEDESTTVLYELYSNSRVFDIEALDVLACIEKYSAEVDFLSEHIYDDKQISIKERIEYVSTITKSTAFWQCIFKHGLLEGSNNDGSTDSHYLHFLFELRNRFIPLLAKDSPEKAACIEVSKMIENADGLEKTHG